MQILNLPGELLLQIAENLSVKDLSHLLRANRRLSCLLTPHFHKLALQDVDSLTALHWAAMRGHASLAELVLSKGAGVDDAKWRGIIPTPLHMAAAHNHPGVIRVLARHGDQINARGLSLSTPLHEAAIGGSTQAVRVLLELGANMTYKDHTTRTPAHISASRGDIDSMRAFIDADLDFYLKDGLDRTVLHEAIINGERTMVEFLLGHGGEKIINARDCFGRTPIHWAVCGSTADEEITRLLCYHGADTEVEDNLGFTPGCYCVIDGRDSVTRVLLECMSTNSRSGTAAT